MGTPAAFASASPGNAFARPGPAVELAAATRPVARAQPSAMNTAFSSWRVSIRRSPTRLAPSNSGRLCPPGRANSTSTPASASARAARTPPCSTPREYMARGRAGMLVSALPLWPYHRLVVASMRAAFFQGYRTITLGELPIPDPGPDEVRLRIRYCGICGSDVSLYKTGALAGPEVILGHEVSAVVDEDPS